jgi:hypothetical protein
MRVRRTIGLWVLCGWVGACCDPPEDPQEPADSEPARSAGEFLALLAKRDDAAAFERLAHIQRFEWSVAEFSAQVDAIPALRSGAAVEWTRVHFVEQESPRSRDVLEQCIVDKLRPVEVDGTIGGTAVVHLRGNRDVSAGWLWNGIEVDGQRVAQPLDPPRNVTAASAPVPAEVRARAPAPAPSPSPAAAPSVQPPAPAVAAAAPAVQIRSITARWETAAVLGIPVLHLVTDVEVAEDLHASVRAVCKQGERLVVDENQLMPRSPDARTGGTFIGYSRELSPCQVEVLQFAQPQLLGVACIESGTSGSGPCDPPLVPTAPADGRTTVDELHVQPIDHLFREDVEVLRMDFLLNVGTPIARVRGHVRVDAVCGTESDQVDARLPSTFDARAGESWWIDAVLFQDRAAGRLPSPCRLDLVLREQKPRAVLEHDERSLGTWCYARDRLRAGPC